MFWIAIYLYVSCAMAMLTLATECTPQMSKWRLAQTSLVAPLIIPVAIPAMLLWRLCRG